MSNNDESTLNVTSFSVIESSPDAYPAVSILWHPDLSRVGAMFSFVDSPVGQDVALSRNSPMFPYYNSKSAPLADPFMSRQACLTLSRVPQGLRIVPNNASVPIVLDGSILLEQKVITLAELSRGCVLTLGSRIALILHLAVPPTLSMGKDLGFLGHSDQINKVRRSILSVSDLDVPVLIRGETGTGKELIARAVALSSTRAKNPFTAVNVGSLPTSTVPAELFGYERGAFTGAFESRKGLFVEADGGTLFLDEIGLAPADVQTALLRVLEAGEVRALGARAVKKVNVRLITATDSPLEVNVKAGSFSPALFHRLSAFQIFLTPLRDRREDIGILFLYFLREMLKETGDLHKIETPVSIKKTWISSEVAAQIAMADWSGNVRQLKNFATQLAVSNRGATRAQLDSTLLSSLSSQKETKPRVSFAAQPASLNRESLLVELEKHGFEPAKVARALNVSRTTIYEMIDKDPTLRKASDIRDDELKQLLKESGNDLSLVSKRLRVSLRALKLRISRS